MPDANTLAIGAPYNYGNGTDAGHVHIYEWSGVLGLQQGADIVFVGKKHGLPGRA